MSEQPTGDTVSEPAPHAEIDPDALTRITVGARRVMHERIRMALSEARGADPAPHTPSGADDEQLERIANEEAERAGGRLLHVAVIHAVSQELGIELQAALEHPVVSRARQLLEHGDGNGPASAVAATDELRESPAPVLAPGTPTPDDGGSHPAPIRQRALLLDAVHVFGIETLESGDRDIELRLADVGIDVRKPSTAEIIGRLSWNEVQSVAVQRPRRGLPGRRRPALLVAGTERGEVTFELPGVSDDEITELVEPLIARNCAGYSGSNPD